MVFDQQNPGSRLQIFQKSGKLILTPYLNFYIFDIYGKNLWIYFLKMCKLGIKFSLDLDKVEVRAPSKTATG